MLRVGCALGWWATVGITGCSIPLGGRCLTQQALRFDSTGAMVQTGLDERNRIFRSHELWPHRWYSGLDPTKVRDAGSIPRGASILRRPIDTWDRTISSPVEERTGGGFILKEGVGGIGSFVDVCS